MINDKARIPQFIIHHLSFIIAVGLLGGCGRISFWEAERLERKGAFAQAATSFRSFAERRPGHARAPEALYRAGVNLGLRVGRCEEARTLWEGAARSGWEPWAGRSREALLECPDYFPLKPGYAWTYVDAQTGGANMRETVEARQTRGALLLERKLFAGKLLVDKRELRYVKADWEVRQTADPSKPGAGQTVLKFPFRTGTTWSAREGKRTLVCSIENADARAKTRAGTFTGCLKVKVKVSGIDEAWKYDYYCPGVGRVLTTVAGPGFEHPNTELASFRKPE